jgi:hypothetical protein
MLPADVYRLTGVAEPHISPDGTRVAYDQVGEARSLVVVIGDGEDVDLGGHRRRVRQLVLAEGAEDGLRADDDYFPRSEELQHGASPSRIA